MDNIVNDLQEAIQGLEWEIAELKDTLNRKQQQVRQHKKALSALIGHQEDRQQQ